MRPLVVVLALAACGDSAATPPDAPIDMAPDSPPPPAGNFTCVGQPRKTTAPDPLTIGGQVLNGTGGALTGAAVEIHNVSDGSVLGTGTTDGFPHQGHYSISIASGGAAPTVYRKATVTGFPDSYLYDAFPLFFATAGPDFRMYTADEQAAYYTQNGLSWDTSKGTVDLLVIDCPDDNGATHLVAGAKVTVAGAAKVVYLDAQGNPSATLTETSTAGYVSALNTLVGSLDITVTAGPYTWRPTLVAGYAGQYTTAYLSP